MSKLHHTTTVAHVIARPGDTKLVSGFDCDHLHELYERVSALEDLLEGVVPLFATYLSDLEDLRRPTRAAS